MRHRAGVTEKDWEQVAQVALMNLKRADKPVAAGGRLFEALSRRNGGGNQGSAWLCIWRCHYQGHGLLPARKSSLQRLDTPMCGAETLSWLCYTMPRTLTATHIGVSS